MHLTFRRSFERAHVHLDWMESYHSFSFADYHDPEHMGFRSLRVINQDLFAPGEGFPPHPHRDMEIFSYVLEGALEHRDSMGNARRLEPGDIQIMSSGSGISHSEFNPSRIELTRLLQIWIKPHTKGLPPSYAEWHPTPEEEEAAKVLVISPDGRGDSVIIRQDADVYRIRLRRGGSVGHELRPGRGAWLQLIKGSVTLNGEMLAPGDAASTEDAGQLTIAAIENAEALLFDLG